MDLAKATADAADASVKADEASINQASAQVQQKQAALNVAETNLHYCKIYAPIDGTVISRAVDVGQTVAASLQAPTLFTIAQDLRQMQVYASTDEGDVGNIHPGQQTTFTVDAFPGERFRGIVSQVRMNPTVVQNVVTYDTIIDFENPSMKLFPGMTAYVSDSRAIGSERAYRTQWSLAVHAGPDLGGTTDSAGAKRDPDWSAPAGKWDGRRSEQRNCDRDRSVWSSECSRGRKRRQSAIALRGDASGRQRRRPDDGQRC